MSARKFDIYKAGKYDNVKVESDSDIIIHVTLHRTVVVRWDRAAGKVTLNSGGWLTLTTKRAINTALRQIPGFMHHVSVFQKRGEWFITYDHGGKMRTALFHDGMIITSKWANGKHFNEVVE